MAQLVKLRFVHHAGAYNPNEIAGFAPDVAARLVRLGVAFPVDQPAPDSTELSQLAADQLALGAKAGRQETGVPGMPLGALSPATYQRIALAHQVLDSQPHPGTRTPEEAAAPGAIEALEPMSSLEVSSAANSGPGAGARTGAQPGGRHGPSTLPQNAPTVDDPGPPSGGENLPDEAPPGKGQSRPKGAAAEQPDPENPLAALAAGPTQPERSAPPVEPSDATRTERGATAPPAGTQGGEAAGPTAKPRAANEADKAPTTEQSKKR